MTPEVDPCRLLDWDTEFFGFRIGQVTVPRVCAEGFGRIRSWMERESVDCVYYLGDTAEPETVQAAQAAGFLLTGVRVTLTHELDGAYPPDDHASARIAPATADDVEPLMEIARVSYADSRFYHDPGFPRERCRELYATWIAKSCAGYADQVLVAHMASAAEPALRRREATGGYITCHLEPGGRGRIGLVAVASEARGRGLGAALVQASLRWFAAAGVTRVTVATQQHNASALKLYERMAFRTESIRPWLHLWSPDR